jgi:metal-responsive CopG/Arc/MetJ family transcriptional regulator
VIMVAKRKEKNIGTKTPHVARTTISFPSDIYETLTRIAKDKKVSFSWVVREAVEKYITDKWPLFKGQ